MKAEPRTKDNRRRFMFRFWLDVAKDEWHDLAQRLENLKQSRQYEPTIRKALLLYLSLKDKRLDVLLELFPWIEGAIKDSDNPGMGDLKSEIERLQQLILGQNQPAGLLSAPKPMNAPTFRTPTFDDLGSDDLIIKKDISTDAGKNFLQSMMALQA